MAGPDLPSTYMTEEQLVAELRRLYDADRPLAAHRPLLVKLGSAATVLGFIGLAALGATGNLAFTNDQKLQAARADYDTALDTLDKVYSQTREAGAGLNRAITDGSTLVTTASSLSHAVNGYVDPDALTTLAATTRELAQTVTEPAAAAVRGPLKPTTTDEYRTAILIIIGQTARDRNTLTATRSAISAIQRDSTATRDGIHQVATTVADIAPRIIQANRRALSATRDECAVAAANVQNALVTGGDVAPALRTYAETAQAVLESATARTGLPAAHVVTPIDLPGIPDQIIAIASASAPAATIADTGSASATPGPTASGPTVADPARQPAANTRVAPTPEPTAAPSAPEAPAVKVAPFALTFQADGPYQPGCKRSIPVGGGIAYGPVGTTKAERLAFGFAYTYQVTAQSQTMVTWAVYACKNGK